MFQLTISLWTVYIPPILHPDGMLVQDVYAFRRSIFRFQAIERSETGQSREGKLQRSNKFSTYSDLYEGGEDIPADYLYSYRHQSGRNRSHQPSLAVSMS